MKKLLYLVTLFLGVISFAQGRLHIFNKSSYDLIGRLFANTPNSSYCLPEVFTSYDVPAGTNVEIKSFNTSNTAYPPINEWGVRTTYTSTVTSAFVPSGLLITLGTITRWHFYWFQTRVAGTNTNTNDPLFTMGESFCGGTSVDYMHGIVTEAKWYYDPVTNETTLIVVDI